MHGLQHALIKAFKKNSANLNPDWLYAALNQSHPSLYERIKAVPESRCMSEIEPKTKKDSINEPLLNHNNEEKAL